MNIYSQKDIDPKELAKENQAEFKGNTVKYTDEYYEELIINMKFKGQTKPRKTTVNAQGWERSAKYYFTELLKQYPRCISQANRNKIESGDFENITVDKTFIDCFPKYAAFQGDVLRHNHIVEDGQAAAIPRTMHSRGYVKYTMLKRVIMLLQMLKSIQIKCKKHMRQDIFKRTMMYGLN